MLQQFAEFHIHATQIFLKNMLLYTLNEHVGLKVPFVRDTILIYFFITYSYPVSRVSMFVFFFFYTFTFVSYYFSQLCWLCRVYLVSLQLKLTHTAHSSAEAYSRCLQTCFVSDSSSCFPHLNPSHIQFFELPIVTLGTSEIVLSI